MEKETDNHVPPPPPEEPLGSGLDLGGSSEGTEPPKEPLPEEPTSPPQLSSPDTPADEVSKIVKLPELKKLSQEAQDDIHVSTLATVPPGYRLIKTLGLVQTAVLLQAKRIQELRLQKGMQDVIFQLKEEAVAQEGNAVLGIQISVTPLGQLYPDSVWITGSGTCCIIERYKKRPPKPQEY